MDGQHFDRIVRRLAGFSRRRALKGLAGGLLGLDAGLFGRPAGAACQKPGKDCARDKRCCSGVCKGKQGKKRCRTAPNQSVCTIRDDVCRDGAILKDCGLGEVTCGCFITTTGRSFCASINAGDPDFDDCTGDLDCLQRLGAGAACLRNTSQCGIPAETFCRLPCSAPI